MKLGLIGFPQVGKRTLFKLLTGQEIGESSHANVVGLARVRDTRFDELVRMYGPAKETPALMDFVLLPDLGEDPERNGELFKGLEQVDVICHLVRAFVDETVFHIAGSVDAERDLNVLDQELQLCDLLCIEKRLDRLHRERGQKIDAQRNARETDLLTRMQAHLEEGHPLRRFPLEESEETLITSYPFLTRKPVIVVLNVDEGQLAASPLEHYREAHVEKDCEWIAVSAKIEEELDQLEAAERQAFLDDLGLNEPALERLTRLCFETLGSISFFTVGEDEVRAWTIPRNSLAPQAGRAIHTDIERGFIRAEVIRYEDLVELGSELKVKESGRLQTRGRDYTVDDGDILHFLFKA
jgi:GTP-binding protein YchF